MNIPARLNLLLLAVAAASSAALLWLASHAGALWLQLAAALAFSFTANTLFSLMHESVHGLLLPDPRGNRWAGRFASARRSSSSVSASASLSVRAASTSASKARSSWGR